MNNGITTENSLKEIMSFISLFISNLGKIGLKEMSVWECNIYGNDFQIIIGGSGEIIHLSMNSEGIEIEKYVLFKENDILDEILDKTIEEWNKTK